MPRIIALPTAPSTGEEVLHRCLVLADAIRERGGLVVFVRVERPGPDPQPEGSELAPQCVLRPGDLEVVKTSWGAFSGGLDAELRARDITTVVLGGIATNFGVESTGRAADDHGFSVAFVSDAMTGLDAHAHDFAVDYVFSRIGVVVTTEELLAELSTLE